MVDNGKRVLVALGLKTELSKLSIKTTHDLLVAVSELGDGHEKRLDPIYRLLLIEQIFGVLGGNDKELVQYWLNKMCTELSQELCNDIIDEIEVLQLGDGLLIGQ